MDLNQIMGVLSTVAKVAKPLSAFGVPGAGLVASAIDVAKNIKERIDDGIIVVTSDDAAKVDQVITDLEAENAALNDYISKS